MSIILVDAKYYGQFLVHARHQLKIHRIECSKILGISSRELKNIEHGRVLIPEKILAKLIINGMSMILCKRWK